MKYTHDNPHWTQTPEGKRKLSLMRKPSKLRKSTVKETSILDVIVNAPSKVVAEIDRAISLHEEHIAAAKAQISEANSEVTRLKQLRSIFSAQLSDEEKSELAMKESA